MTARLRTVTPSEATVAGSANVISGNLLTGITIQAGSSQNTVAGNLIGTDLAGTSRIGNGIAGILISEAPNNVIGPGNVVSANGNVSQGAGIWIEGQGATGNLVIGNKVGTDLAGEARLGNTIIGVLINDASNNTIGGSTAGATNVISGNAEIGVMIAGTDGSANLVVGNLIGTNVQGTNSIPNGSSTQGAGVYIDNAARGTPIGGTSAGMGNLISGNGPSTGSRSSARHRRREPVPGEQDRHRFHGDSGTPERCRRRGRQWLAGNPDRGERDRLERHERDYDHAVPGATGHGRFRRI